MTNGWTPERKAAMSKKIQEWKPWEKSTGAKTPEGKAKIAQNAFKGGEWRKQKFKAWMKRNQSNPDKLPLDALIAETLRRSKGLDMFNPDGTLKD